MDGGGVSVGNDKGAGKAIARTAGGVTMNDLETKIATCSICLLSSLRDCPRCRFIAGLSVPTAQPKPEHEAVWFSEMQAREQEVGSPEWFAAQPEIAY